MTAPFEDLKSNDSSRESFVDRLIGVVDTGIKTLTDRTAAEDMPDIEEEELNASDAELSASLMRVNHTGEVCAQGLYEGQALVAREKGVREHLLHASNEERSHLALCRTRLHELDSSPSILAPLFYGASVGVGIMTGLLGDRISLGFVEATEDQVCEHVDRHLAVISQDDGRSRAILERIRADEQRHGENAVSRGGAKYPQSIKQFMTLASKIMTETTKRI